jgi:HK97 gp10 family phage protein
MASDKNIEGMSEVINALEAIGVDIKSPKLQKLLRKSAEPIIATAKSLVPVNTGDLRDSIGFITTKDSTNLDKALIGLRREYYHAYLGVMFEFGTAERFQKNGRHTGVISKSAHPFMRPALDRNAANVTDKVIKGVDSMLRDLAKKNNLIYK